MTKAPDALAEMDCYLSHNSTVRLYRPEYDNILKHTSFFPAAKPLGLRTVRVVLVLVVVV